VAVRIDSRYAQRFDALLSEHGLAASRWPSRGLAADAPA